MGLPHHRPIQLDRRPDVEQRVIAELAARSSFEKEWLKLNIRKLKNLGLTESLAVGYRLLPRGAALLTMMQDEKRRKRR